MKKAEFYYEAAAMAGQEVARYNYCNVSIENGVFEKGYVSRESIDSILESYNCSLCQDEERKRCLYPIHAIAMCEVQK
jgi:hypothetical protein